MQVLPKLFTDLVAALTILPGVGPKSAQRMALHLLLNKPSQAQELAETLQKNLSDIRYCERCRCLTEQTTCAICLDPQRDASTICIVENLSDLLSIEQTATYRGHYFVLMGCLSPIDRVGPEQLGIPTLLDYIESNAVNEIILANNPTIEGEATAHYLASKIASHIKVSRLASGIPIGTELTYVNDHTLHQALSERKEIQRHVTEK